MNLDSEGNEEEEEEEEEEEAEEARRRRRRRRRRPDDRLARVDRSRRRAPPPPPSRSASSSSSPPRDTGSVWSWARLEREVFAGVDAAARRASAIEWARSRGLLRREIRCRVHKIPMAFDVARSGYGQFRCPRRGSLEPRERPARGEERSAAFGMWFQHHSVPIETAIRLMYCWARRLPYRDARNESPRADSAKLSTATMCNWFGYCRELVTARYVARERERGRIGGPGRVVQIDEAKFGKRKYNRGRGVARGHWLLGMIEDGSQDFRLEVCPGGKRTAGTILPLVQRHVAPGSIVRTDKWRAYSGLVELGYAHETVNHAIQFVTEDGVHTQRIEAMWRPMRAFFRGRTPATDRFADHCVEYQWRRHCRHTGVDTFDDLLKALAAARVNIPAPSPLRA